MAEVFIYVYSNCKLGKAYVGQSNNPERRARQHYLRWAKGLDADERNWQIGIIEIVEAKSGSKFAMVREQLAIDAFTARFGRNKLLNKCRYACTGKITGRFKQHKGWRLPIEGQDYCTLLSAQEPSHER